MLTVVVFGLTWAGAVSCGVRGARAATVRGAVQFPDEVRDGAPRRGGYWRVPNGVLPIAPPQTDVRTTAVVVLTPQEGGRAGEAPKEPDKPQLVLKGLGLQPPVLVAQRGAVLALRSEEPRASRLVLACAEAEAVQIQLAPRGQTSAPLGRAGLCTLRSPDYGHLEGAVVVVDGGAPSARVDEAGAFRLEVPEGRYQALLYWQGAARGAQSLEVPAAGAELRFDLRQAGERPRSP